MVGSGTVKISDRWSFGKNEKKVERGKLRKLESDGHNFLRQETILFEKMKEEECKLGTQIKWIRSRKPAESTWYKSIRGKEKGSAESSRDGIL